MNSFSPIEKPVKWPWLLRVFAVAAKSQNFLFISIAAPLVSKAMCLRKTGRGDHAEISIADDSVIDNTMTEGVVLSIATLHAAPTWVYLQRAPSPYTAFRNPLYRDIQYID